MSLSLSIRMGILVYAHVRVHACTGSCAHAGACVWDGGERLAKYGRVWPVCHAPGTQPLASIQTNPTRGVRGETIDDGNILFAASKTSKKFKSVRKSKSARTKFCKLSPQKPRSVCWMSGSKICSLARHGGPVS